MKLGSIGCLLALALAVGCSSPTVANATTSSNTDAALGVDHWSSAESAGQTVVEGADTDGNVRVRFTQTMTKDESGTTHGAITANIDGSPTFEFTVAADGTGTVLKNDFPNSPTAVAAAKAAQADLQRSGVETKDISLVTSGGVPLSAGKCAATLVAVTCIVAALCGIGGDSGAEVLGSVVEAGTEQCE